MKDVIPRVPRLMGYSHVGRCIALKEDGSLDIDGMRLLQAILPSFLPCYFSFFLGGGCILPSFLPFYFFGGLQPPFFPPLLFWGGGRSPFFLPSFFEGEGGKLRFARVRPSQGFVHMSTSRAEFLDIVHAGVPLITRLGKLVWISFQRRPRCNAIITMQGM